LAVNVHVKPYKNKKSPHFVSKVGLYLILIFFVFGNSATIPFQGLGLFSFASTTTCSSLYGPALLQDAPKFPWVCLFEQDLTAT